jgi:flagellar hook protein FlgE
MLRSMFTAISALNLHQYFMDVVADNLANANTNGFKASRFSFQDQFAQMMSFGSAPDGTNGGVNPVQIGLGTRIGTTTPSFVQGSLQATGQNTDMAIQGDGFFIYSNGQKNFYSRDGTLAIDSDGYLVHAATGMRIQGWQANAGVVNAGQATTGIQLPLGSSLARATTNAALGGNLDSSTAIGDSYDVTAGVYDSLGTLHSVTLTFQHDADNSWSWTASGGGASGNGTIVFDDQGQYQSGTGSVTIPASAGAAAVNFTPDLSKITQLATTGDVSVLNQDGLAAGDLTTFFVSSDNGEVYGLYSNGMQELVGQLALANFVNPSGLTRSGQNMFEQGLNSGEPSVGAADSGGRGSIASGYLEGSNVDMSQEFTNMILAERGFQASSRVITTSDEMLQELVNLKR